MYRKCLKRALDCGMALVAILLFFWVFLLLAALVKATSKGPVFFVQKRVGLNKKLFPILKFRTMRIDTPKDCPTHLLQNPNQYITPIGAFLRRTSLDELPQLLNIFVGHMAVVGPRPALWNQSDLIALRDQNGANSIRPGLTGWAQINGRDELSVDLKAQLDGEYVQKLSPLFDIKCIFWTIIKVVRHDGVVEGAHMEPSKAEKELIYSSSTQKTKDRG